LGDFWLHAAFTFIVTRDGVIIRDADLEGAVEIQKGRVAVLTRPCIMTVARSEVELQQCGFPKYAKGRWIQFDRHIAPTAEKEYYEAAELYEMFMQTFRKIVERISDIAFS
jgi:hypothetical protein